MSNCTHPCLLSTLLAASIAFPARAPAEGSPRQSLRLVGQVTPFLSGTAGSGSGAPDYGDAFATGIGGALEYHRRLSERFSALGGIGYDAFSGETHEGVSFGDLDRLSLYGGARIHLASPQSAWQPYIRGDLGAIRSSGVTVTAEGASGSYWDAGWGLMADLGAGIEKHLGAWSLFGEILVRYSAAPDSAMGRSADADAAWTLPLRVGVGYAF